jgi:hypothetical protein
VAIVRGEIHPRDDLYNCPKRRPVVDLERGVTEEKLPGGRKDGQLVELFDSAAQGVEELVAC